MGTVVLMCGLPGAGKSTYARGLVARGYARLSIDEVVWQRLGGRDAGVVLDEAGYDALKEVVRAEQRLRLVELVRAGRDVVVDYSFWSRAARDDYRRLVEQCGGRCELVYLKAGRAVLEQRLAVRNRQSGADAVTVRPELLERYLAQFEEPCGEGESVVDQVDHPALVARARRNAGTVVGAAVGDALGAPFEFGPAGAFSIRFPAPGGGGEMCGGGGWEPGEATDDTQMAVLVGESLLRRDGFDPAHVFAAFQGWARSAPKDIGLQTEDVLTNGLPWDQAAAIHFRTNLRAAGNGSLMRASTSAVYFAAAGRSATMDAARRIAALTHGDRAAWEGTAVFHELVRIALDGGDPLAELPEVLELVHPEHRDRYAVVLDPRWHPDRATEANGAVWPCLGSAVWAVRSTDGFEAALRAAIDLGGDTDTVAAVTGGLAGACYGLDAIPARWTEPLHVPLPGSRGRVLRLPDLVELAGRLGG